MRKIKNIISLFIISCIVLCGCGNSDLLNFDEPAFKERYEEITDSLCTACTANFHSNNPYSKPTVFDKSNVDLSTVKIKRLGNVYNPKYSDFNTRFCGIEIEFERTDSDVVETASFILIVEDGIYNGNIKAPKGATDTTVSIDEVEELVYALEKMLESNEEKSKIKVDYYASTIDMEYLNKMLSEKLEEYMNNNSSNIIKDSYKNILDDLSQEYAENDLTYREYCITDINDDDIPEMILFLGDNIENATLGIFTFKNNQPYDCGWFSTGINVNNEDELQYVSENSQYTISKGDNCIYASFCYNGYQHTNIISLDENISADISEYYDSGTEELSYYDIPGEPLESADFLDDSVLNNYFS